MVRYLIVSLCLLALGWPAQASGLLMPSDRQYQPLALISHKVKVSIDEQVAETLLTQTFRNHTDRNLEATYYFPVPRGADVHKLMMKVGDKEFGGEVLEKAKAREIYNEIVRRTKDPAILEYMEADLLRVQVFPVPPRQDVQISVRYLSIVKKDSQTCEYVYPVRTTSPTMRMQEDFDIKVTVKARDGIHSIYSPTHGISIQQPNLREAIVQFERRQTILDQDFHLIYGVGKSEIGMSAIFHKPTHGDDGYFLALISPTFETPREKVIPRDFMLVLDTSGSMEGVKMEQAKKAMKKIVGQFRPDDRFGMLNFATNVNKYRDELVTASRDRLEDATDWIGKLRSTGGTAIDAALQTAQEMRPKESNRPFTIIFFTDGLPTVGEQRTEKILENVKARNTASTRIFSFGVGDDVNASFLDSLSEQTRSVSTYVRPAEDIEEKTASMLAKIAVPALTNLRLTTGDNVRLYDIYPTQLPDLFQGGQLVVLGRFSGRGSATLKLTGSIGDDRREFGYPGEFPEKTDGERDFVEQLWARRKVGFLLDQIRLNGEQKELIAEIVTLAKKYGIATPFTSYLVVPDIAQPVIWRDRVGLQGVNGPASRPEGLSLDTKALSDLASRNDPAKPAAFGGGGFGGQVNSLPIRTNAAAKEPTKVEDYAKQLAKGNAMDNARNVIENDRFDKDQKEAKRQASAGEKGAEARAKSYEQLDERQRAFSQTLSAAASGTIQQSQSGQLGVSLSIFSNQLRSQSQISPTANRIVNGRNALEVGGVWIDQGYTEKMAIVSVKAQSKAYFDILERHPELKAVYALGNHLVYVTPSGTALAIDANAGKEELTPAEIDALFAKK